MKRVYLAIIFSGICLSLLLLQFFFFEDTPVPFEKGDKTVRLSLISEPLSLDPRKSSDGITSQFFNFCFDGLTRRSFNDKIDLSLAKDVKISDDGLEYVFLIREAYWSNGELITACDFENSWKKVLDSSFIAHNPDYFFNIKNARKAYFKEAELDDVGIESLDAHHLKISLEYPDPYFLELVSNKIFFPINHKIDRKYPNWGDLSLKHFVSCGPFVIKKWLPRNRIILKKNPYYWDEQNVRLDGLELFLVEDEMTQLSMYENNELDWVGSPLSLFPIDALSKLKDSPEFGSFPSSSLYYCCFNNDVYPLNHVKIRQALSLAINRQDLIRYISQGHELPALTLLPQTMHVKHVDYIKDGYEAEAITLFQEALKELNLTIDNFPTLTFSFPNVYSRKLLAQAIQQQWEQTLGLKVILQSVEWQTFLSDLKNGRFHLSAIARGTHHLDPFYFLSLFQRKFQDSNLARWESSEYQKVLQKIKLSNDLETRNCLVNEAEKIFMQQMPIAPIFFPSNYFLKKPKLHNVLITSVGSLDFKWAYLDK